jgi:hypothetical protein
MLEVGFFSWEKRILIVPGLAFWNVTAFVMVITLAVMFSEQVKI